MRFVAPSAVEAEVARSGVDLSRAFGLDDAEYRDLARALGVDYVVDGVVTVRKELTFAGWRKDVDVYVHLHAAADGGKVDSWRSMTDFTWARGSTALDARRMAESAASHTCAKMLATEFWFPRADRLRRKGPGLRGPFFVVMPDDPSTGMDGAKTTLTEKITVVKQRTLFTIDRGAPP